MKLTFCVCQQIQNSCCCMPMKYGCILVKVRYSLFQDIFITICSAHHYYSKLIMICLVDGGTAQPCRESAYLEIDGKDDVDGFESWRSLAEQLRQDLASIILMSEANLQVCLILPFYFATKRPLSFTCIVIFCK